MPKVERFWICNKGETATFLRDTKTFGSPCTYDKNVGLLHHGMAGQRSLWRGRVLIEQKKEKELLPIPPRSIFFLLIIFLLGLM